MPNRARTRNQRHGATINIGQSAGWVQVRRSAFPISGTSRLEHGTSDFGATESHTVQSQKSLIDGTLGRSMVGDQS